ncbi:hypothetical protein [Aeromonas caviae]|uniref:hypothetical protein n=1 Tax=Aeromonas caviae TaxID=648 RepID=UPI001CC70C33|nr:hypothetical protein [Aeromonas caviae]GJC19628.1 hypothetical protein KAM377_31100 [Aeromonas caviae]
MTWPSARMFLVSSPVPLDVLLAGAAGNPGSPAAGAAPVAWPPARMFLVRSPGPLDVLPAGAAGNQEHLLQEQHR